MKTKQTLFLIGCLLIAAKSYSQNPYESLGVKVEPLTLSKGKYVEFFDNDIVVQIGTVLFNTQTNEIVAFLKEDTLRSEAALKPEVISRWLSPDPLASEFPSWSPYNYVLNNPIVLIDPDGAYPYTFHVRSFHPNQTFAGGFMGDNRGFSNNPSASSRIGHHFTFDPATGQTSNKGFDNNFSMHAAGLVATHGAWGIGKEIPRETGYDVSGSNGSYSINTGYEGANPLLPGSPDIDVHSAFNITENLKEGILSISANITGDAFPSSEAFVVDQSGKNSVFIGVSGLNNKTFTSLFGDFQNDMMKANFNITLDKKGNFNGVKVGDKSYTISEWNKQFQNQSAE